MATFTDEREEELNLAEDEQLSSLDTDEDMDEEIPEEEQPTEPEEIQEQEDDELPEKYRNKSVKDIIAMHQNAEQLIGKQSQEVGELRRAIDTYIASQTVTAHNNNAQEDDFDETAFFENPRESLEKLIAKHPSVQQSQLLAAQLKKAESLAKLKASHPDFADVIKDEKFAEWIKKSKVRTQLFQQADKQYDYDAADELITLWKERAEAVNMTVESEKKQRKESVKSASSGNSKGSGEKPSRKIYRRADLIELMKTDPERYASLMPEIRQAYAEKRVR